MTTALCWGLAALTLLGFALRLYHLGYQSMWRDEVDSIRFALTDRPWERMWSKGFNGPLYYLLLQSWVSLVGRSEFAARFNASLWGTSSVPLTFLLGRRLAGKGPALLAALLVATSPYLIWYGQEVKMYSLLVGLILLALYCYHRALRGGGFVWWAGTVVSVSLSFYIHILTPLLLPLMLLWFWAVPEKPWKSWLPTMALLTLPYVPLVLWQAPLLFTGYSPGHPPVSFSQMLAMLLSGWSRGILGEENMLLLTVFVFLLLVGILLVRSDPDGGTAVSLGRWRKEVLPLLLYLTVPVLSMYLITLASPIFTDRYLIWCAPAFYLLIGRGLSQILRRGQVVGVLGIAFVVCLNFQSVWQQAHTPIKSDFRAAATYFYAHRTGDELVVFLIPYNRYTFEYYYQEPYRWAEGLYTNRGEPEEIFAQQMEKMTADYRAVWLVNSEAEMWDSRGLVRAWLQEHRQLDDEAHFMRVSLYRYTLRPPQATEGSK